MSAPTYDFEKWGHVDSMYSQYNSSSCLLGFRFFCLVPSGQCESLSLHFTLALHVVTYFALCQVSCLHLSCPMPIMFLFLSLCIQQSTTDYEQRLKEIATKQEEQTTAENRWTGSWQTAVQKVKDLY